MHTPPAPPGETTDELRNVVDPPFADITTVDVVCSAKNNASVDTLPAQNNLQCQQLISL
jgi:hypothetical protein